MKKLFTLFFLIFFNFSILSYAENIENIEMEGISIGDSLLKFFSEEEILNQKEFIYANEKSFSKDVAGIFYTKNLLNYESVQIDFKFNDPNFTIIGLNGYITYENDMSNCYKKQDEILNDLKSIFNNVEIMNDFEDHPGYPKGEVKYKRYSFLLVEGERSNLEIMCIEALNYNDRLSVSMKSIEFNNWMFKLYN